jgi:hypothetical protein
MTYDAAQGTPTVRDGASVADSRLPHGVNQTTLNQAAPKVDVSLFDVKCVEAADGRVTFTSCRQPSY